MKLPNLNLRKIATVLFDEFHSESWSVSRNKAAEMQADRPENSSYCSAAAELSAREYVVERNINQEISPELLSDKDVLVLLHPCDPEIECTTSKNTPKLSTCEIKAVHDFVKQGGGLFVVTEYENQKYGNNLNEILTEYGITIDAFTTVTDRTGSMNEEKTHVLADLNSNHDNTLIGVNKACFYRTGACKAKGNAKILVAASANAKPKQAGLIAVCEYGQGRVVVVNDSDIFGDEFLYSHDHLQLWLNLFYWMSEPAFGALQKAVIDQSANETNADWLRLKSNIDGLRQFHCQRRQPDNKYIVETRNPEQIEALVSGIKKSIAALTGHFPHNREYHNALIEDFELWRKGGFQRPNFVRSLGAFNPQASRRENIEHLVVFPLYTPNSSLDVFFEALIVRVPWYDWLAEMESSQFKNEKFVPGHLVAHTKGYDSECAVLFPETVSVNDSKSAPNNFGVIFCDREAKRYQRYVQNCAEIVHLNVPPDLACLLRSLDLVSDMFAAWDLVHDTSHSSGPLPFDPFMIRQVAPYWMYGLEELRVDLCSVKAGIKLAKEGFHFGKAIAYGVLFDRIFRFAITGTRIKNYDGLGGQLLFAALQEKAAIAWENNRLTVLWHKVFDAITALSSELDDIYKRGARQSDVRRFREGHKLIAKYLDPAIGSKWHQAESVNLAEDAKKDWIAQALPDEFPLGSFHLQLKKKYEKRLASVSTI
jgi:hypothetical protein